MASSNSYLVPTDSSLSQHFFICSERETLGEGAYAKVLKALRLRRNDRNCSTDDDDRRTGGTTVGPSGGTYGVGLAVSASTTATTPRAARERMAALKICARESHETVASFLNELELLRELNQHPHVVEVLSSQLFETSTLLHGVVNVLST